ncbi:MAG TPA: hypothetical protein VHN14_21375 [Kofleriaceae bacterium]|nr:hypothetical protein [Kofleriaceae bacterium]
MVAHPASPPHGFSPVESPGVSVAADGTFAAITESPRVTLLELPSGTAFAEIGVDPDALASEVAWVSTPPRLLVLSRYAAHTTVHLLDPSGPHTIAEIRMESPMRLCATVGAFALVVGAQSAAVLAASESHVMPHPFPARVMPVAAGAAAGQFVVALAGSIEEWDPQSRMPKRRLRLPRTAAITAVGGSDRVVWMTTQQEPARIDVIPLVNRGQPKAHDLPEPIARIAGHPRSDLVACIGAHSGRLYIVDLDGRTRLRVIGPGGIDRIEAAGLVVGRMLGVLAAQAQRPIAIMPLDSRDFEAALPRSEPDEPAKPAPLPEARGERAAPREPHARDDHDERRPLLPAAALSSPKVAASAATQSAASTGERFSAWRDLVRQNQPRVNPIASVPGAAGSLARSDARQSWRDEVVVWSRTIAAGAMDDHAPLAPAIDAVLARFDLALQLRPVLVLLYGAHLCGERGVAPVDVARILDRQWDEALGRGELAQRGVADYAGSRVTLSPGILRVLDELPPVTGTLVGAPGPVALLGPCIVVAGDEPLPTIAAQCLSHVGGAILASSAGADRAELLFEARAYGAAPMFRIAESPATTATHPAVFVVSDAELADQLGFPRLF